MGVALRQPIRKNLKNRTRIVSARDNHAAIDGNATDISLGQYKPGALEVALGVGGGRKPPQIQSLMAPAQYSTLFAAGFPGRRATRDSAFSRPVDP